MITPTPIELSQGYEVLQPKTDKAIPVPCSEWDFLHGQIAKLTTEPWLFQTLGSVLLGASLATAISIWTGAVIPSQAKPNALVIAWAVTMSCLITGLACMYFAHKERKIHRTKADNVSTQMKLIENRFDRNAPNSSKGESH